MQLWLGNLTIFLNFIYFQLFPSSLSIQKLAILKVKPYFKFIAKSSYFSLISEYLILFIHF